MAGIKDIGEFIREQRRLAQFSLRQLAEQTGVSNPYLSQIERGLRKPSAEVLQQIGAALRVSTPIMYLRAGLLEDRESPGVLTAVADDDGLNDRQKQVLVEIYESFRRENATAATTAAARDRATTASRSADPWAAATADAAEDATGAAGTVATTTVTVTELPTGAVASEQVTTRAPAESSADFVSGPVQRAATKKVAAKKVAAKKVAAKKVAAKKVANPRTGGKTAAPGTLAEKAAVAEKMAVTAPAAKTPGSKATARLAAERAVAAVSPTDQSPPEHPATD